MRVYEVLYKMMVYEVLEGNERIRSTWNKMRVYEVLE